MVWKIFENLESEGAKNLNAERITFKVHITNHKFIFWYIYGRKCTKYLHGTSLLNILVIFGIKEKLIILTNVMLAIATNIYCQKYWHPF